MKPAEAAALLAIAAAYDNRKPDADQAKAWAMALDGLRFEDCRDVIVQHYRVSRDWLMPSDVVSGVRQVRRNRLLEFGPIPEPPREIDPGDAAAYQSWLTDMQRRIADGELTRPEPRELEPDRRGVDYGALMAADPATRQQAIAAARAAISRGDAHE